MNNPLISIIIPIYNVEEFLPQCLDSAINQTYRNLEIILINDGSPDNSEAICLEYAKKDDRVKYFKQKNGGVSAARNNGLGQASGDYIFFLDSDDYLSADCINDLVSCVDGNVLPVTGFVIDFYDKGSIVTPAQSNGVYNNIYDFFIDFHKYFATKLNFPWGKLYKSSIIKDNGLSFTESLSVGEDIVFNLQYYRCCNTGVMMLKSCGYYYRQHGSGTLSKKFNPNLFDWNELVYTSIRDFLLENNTMTEVNRSHFYNNVFGNLEYAIVLLINSNDYSLKEKAVIINKYTSTQLAKEVFKYSTSKSVQSKIAKTCLRDGHPYLHIFTVKIINLLRKLKRAFN